MQPATHMGALQIWCKIVKICNRNRDINNHNTIIIIKITLFLKVCNYVSTACDGGASLVARFGTNI